MTSGQNPFTIISSNRLPIRLDFRMGVAHSLASRFFTVNVLLELESDSGYYGFGECVPRSYVTGESPESVLRTLQDLTPQVIGYLFESPEEVLSRLESIGRSETARYNPAAMCALELAVLDCAGKHWDVGVPELTGLARSDKPLIYSLVVPMLPPDTLDLFLENVKQYDFSHVKVKVDVTDPAGRISRVREALGDSVEIRVDANCSWDRDNAPGFMRSLADRGVVAAEQPLPADNLAGMAMLKRLDCMDIVLDESAITPSHVERAARLGSCDIINVRISKCGGILGALRIISTAREHGLGVQLGAQVGESCILSSAGAHLASGVPEFRWLEGFFGTHLLRHDLCSGEIRFANQGMVFQPDGPGMGVPVDPNLVDQAYRNYEVTNKRVKTGWRLEAGEGFYLSV